VPQLTSGIHVVDHTWTVHNADIFGHIKSNSHICMLSCVTLFYKMFPNCPARMTARRWLPDGFHHLLPNATDFTAKWPGKFLSNYNGMTVYVGHQFILTTAFLV